MTKTVVLYSLYKPSEESEAEPGRNPPAEGQIKFRRVCGYTACCALGTYAQGASSLPQQSVAPWRASGWAFFDDGLLVLIFLDSLEVIAGIVPVRFGGPIEGQSEQGTRSGRWSTVSHQSDSSTAVSRFVAGLHMHMVMLSRAADHSLSVAKEQMSVREILSCIGQFVALCCAAT